MSLLVYCYSLSARAARSCIFSTGNFTLSCTSLRNRRSVVNVYVHVLVTAAHNKDKIVMPVTADFVPLSIAG